PAVTLQGYLFARQQNVDSLLQLPGAGNRVQPAGLEAAVPYFTDQAAGHTDRCGTVIGIGIQLQLVIFRAAAKGGAYAVHLHTVLLQSEAGFANFKLQLSALRGIVRLQTDVRYP